jgi:PKD repeat protein
LGNITISVNDVTIKYLEFKPAPEDAAILVKENVTGTTLELNKFFREECESDTIIGVESLGGSIVNAEYNWWSIYDGPYNGILDNGELSDGLGVTVIGEVYVEPWLGIHASADISAMHVMVGDPIMFDGTDSFGYDTEKNELNLFYLWDFDNGIWSMEDQISYSYDEPGIYHGYLRVSANDVNLWSRTMYDWDYFTIVVSEPGQVLNANADGNDLGEYEGIINEPVTFYGTASGGVPGYTFRWNINGHILTGQNVEYTFTETGTFTIELTVTDSEFNTATDTATVYIAGLDELVAKAGGPYDSIASEPIFLIGDASGGKAPYTFSWDFGDGTAPITAKNPLHIYETKGTYTLCLTVTDYTGTVDEAITTVIVSENHGQPEIFDVKGGLGITATVNTADLPVDWMVNFNGGFVFGRTTSTGTIAPNTEEIIRTPYVFGFGTVDISIQANDAISKHTAFMIGPFILFLK